MTGGLLGRYIAEERDSGRKLADCYALVCAGAKHAARARSNGGKKGGKSKSKGKAKPGRK